MNTIFSLVALPFKLIAMIFRLFQNGTIQDVAVLSDLAREYNVKITYYKGM